MALFVLCLGPSVGRTCSCGEITATTAYSAASDVFVGTVLSVGRESSPEGDPNNYVSLRLHYVKARIRIEQSWKGSPAGQVVTLYTDLSCGVGLPKGEVVLLFAKRAPDGPWKGGLYARLCGQPTTLAYDISAASDSLGPPKSVRRATK